LSGNAEGFSASGLPLWALLIFFAIPHTLMWGSYSMTIYQWASINHHSRLGKLSKDMFTKYLWLFCLMTATIFSLIWISFFLFLYYMDTEAAIAGPAILAFMTFSFATLLTFVGRQTIGVMKSIKSAKGDNRVKRVLEYIRVLTLGLMLESVALVIASAFSLDSSQLLSALAAYYFADLFIVATQLDFMLGSKGSGCLVQMRSRIFSSTGTSKASKTDKTMSATGSAHTKQNRVGGSSKNLLQAKNTNKSVTGMQRGSLMRLTSDFVGDAKSELNRSVLGIEGKSEMMERSAVGLENDSVSVSHQNVTNNNKRLSASVSASGMQISYLGSPQSQQSTNNPIIAPTRNL